MVFSDNNQVNQNYRLKTGFRKTVKFFLVAFFVFLNQALLYELQVYLEDFFRKKGLIYSSEVEKTDSSGPVQIFLRLASPVSPNSWLNRVVSRTINGERYNVTKVSMETKTLITRFVGNSGSGLNQVSDLTANVNRVNPNNVLGGNLSQTLIPKSDSFEIIKNGRVISTGEVTQDSKNVAFDSLHKAKNVDLYVNAGNKNAVAREVSQMFEGSNVSNLSDGRVEVSVPVKTMFPELSANELKKVVRDDVLEKGTMDVTVREIPSYLKDEMRFAKYYETLPYGDLSKEGGQLVEEGLKKEVGTAIFNEDRSALRSIWASDFVGNNLENNRFIDREKIAKINNNFDQDLKEIISTGSDFSSLTERTQLFYQKRVEDLLIKSDYDGAEKIFFDLERASKYPDLHPKMREMYDKILPNLDAQLAGEIKVGEKINAVAPVAPAGDLALTAGATATASKNSTEDFFNSFSPEEGAPITKSQSYEEEMSKIAQSSREMEGKTWSETINSIIESPKELAKAASAVLTSPLPPGVGDVTQMAVEKTIENWDRESPVPQTPVNSSMMNTLERNREEIRSLNEKINQAQNEKLVAGTGEAVGLAEEKLQGLNSQRDALIKENNQLQTYVGNPINEGAYLAGAQEAQRRLMEKEGLVQTGVGPEFDSAIKLDQARQEAQEAREALEKYDKTGEWGTWTERWMPNLKAFGGKSEEEWVAEQNAKIAAADQLERQLQKQINGVDESQWDKAILEDQKNQQWEKFKKDILKEETPGASEMHSGAYFEGREPELQESGLQGEKAVFQVDSEGKKSVNLETGEAFSGERNLFVSNRDEPTAIDFDPQSPINSQDLTQVYDPAMSSYLEFNPKLEDISFDEGKGIHVAKPDLATYNSLDRTVLTDAKGINDQPFMHRALPGGEEAYKNALENNGNIPFADPLSGTVSSEAKPLQGFENYSENSGGMLIGGKTKETQEELNRQYSEIKSPSDMESWIKNSLSANEALTSGNDLYDIENFAKAVSETYFEGYKNNTMDPSLVTKDFYQTFLNSKEEEIKQSLKESEISSEFGNSDPSWKTEGMIKPDPNSKESNETASTSPFEGLSDFEIVKNTPEFEKLLEEQKNVTTEETNGDRGAGISPRTSGDRMENVLNQSESPNSEPLVPGETGSGSEQKPYNFSENFSGNGSQKEPFSNWSEDVIKTVYYYDPLSNEIKMYPDWQKRLEESGFPDQEAYLKPPSEEEKIKVFKEEIEKAKGEKAKEAQEDLKNNDPKVPEGTETVSENGKKEEAQKEEKLEEKELIFVD